MKKLLMMCVFSAVALAAFAQKPKDTGFFVAAGTGMNFGFDGLAFEDRPTSHNGAGYAGDFYAGAWMTDDVGIRVGYQGFGISDRFTDFGNRRYSYIHGDLLLQPCRSVVPYIHSGSVGIVGRSWGGGIGIMFPFHVGRHVCIVPDLKATGYSSRAFAVGQNNFAMTVSATVGVAFCFGAKEPEPEPEVVIEPIIQTVHDTVIVTVTETNVIKESDVDVLRDTVYIPSIPEQPLVLNAETTFDVNSDILRMEAYPELDKLADMLKVHPKARARIEGHTDNTGSADYNQGLSERRAMSVYRYLVIRGISPERLSYIGYGYSRPVATNSTPEGRRLNRRVEISVKEYD